MAFIDNGAGNSMAYGCDSKGAYSAFGISLGGCEAYEDGDVCKGCETVNPKWESVDANYCKCPICGEKKRKI